MMARSTFRILFFGLFFFFPLIAQASVILSEVEVGGDKAADEFVELYNTDSNSVNLSGYSLRRKSQSDVTVKGSSLKTFGSSDTIPAHGYFLWASSAGIFNSLADTTTTGGLSDNNSLGLFDKNGNLLESLTWGTGHLLPFSLPQFDNPEKKESFTRDLDTLSWSKTKKISPTNSKGEVWQEPTPPPPPPPKPFTQIVINEVFPNPKEKGDLGEFIEFYNPLSDTVDLSLWEIHDASATGKYIFPNGTKIEAKGYFVITDQEFTFALNNTDETLTLFDTEKRLVHSVHYDKTKKSVTLNLVGDKLRGSKTPTPGKENILNTDPVTQEKVPKSGYQDIPVEFRAKGSDQDGDSLKYTWDFGDDHKSYKGNTTHTYQETGTYTVTLSTDDGSDTTTETFTIEITQYKPPKLKIVALMPNPEGKDSDLEWIEIKNDSKKSVNLAGFSIATGSKKKKLTNHPIRHTVKIKGGSTERLSRDDALFTLNNKKGFVELRDPTGEVLSRFKYHFEHNLEDDTILKRVKGKGIVAEAPVTETPQAATPKNEVAALPETATPEEDATREASLELAPPAVEGVSVDAPLTPEGETATTTEKISWLESLNTWLNTWFDWLWH